MEEPIEGWAVDIILSSYRQEREGVPCVRAEQDSGYRGSLTEQEARAIMRLVFPVVNGAPPADPQTPEPAYYVKCGQCAGTGYLQDGDGMEHNCDVCNTTGFAPAAQTPELPKGNLPWCPRCIAVGPATIPINGGQWHCLECSHDWTPPAAQTPEQAKEKSMTSDIPRRCYVEKQDPAEHAIAVAIQAVEGAGADVRLTDAVVLLQAAKDSVGDFIDGIDQRRFVALTDAAAPLPLQLWQDIATAPKMRTILLFAVTDVAEDGTVRNWKMATGGFMEGYDDERSKARGFTGWEWAGYMLKTYDHQPTHWMPLPNPPGEKS